ncbi:permease [bacterium]|nr:permease [bacterium]
MQHKPENKFENIAQRIIVTVVVLLALFILNKGMTGELPQVLLMLKTPKMQVFTIVLLAILLEGLTFLLLGSCLSGAIEVFVPGEFLEKRFPKKKIPSALSGALLGIVFPVCSCGNIPLTRRLIKKGVPVTGAISYLLAAPIINPITVASTIMAFSSLKSIWLERVGIAFLVACISGLIFSRYDKSQILKDLSTEADSCSHHHTSQNKIVRVLQHAEHDFFLTGKYFVIGAIIASLFQTVIPRTILGNLGQNHFLSVLLLGLLGMLFSLCSFADAFVVSTFSSFPSVAKVVFMTAGPMIGASIMFLYFGAFKKKFTGRLILTVACLLLLISVTRIIMGG